MKVASLLRTATELMKFIFTTVCLGFFALSLIAQKPDEVLATATGLTFTPSALSEDGRKLFLSQNTVVASERTRLLSQMEADLLLDAEARSLGVTRDLFVTTEMKKVAAPTETEIKQVFDANRANFGERTIDDVRKQIVAFLRQNAEQKALNDLVESLKAKYKFAPGKDINAADLKPMEAVFTITGKSVSAQEFDARYKADIYDVRAEIAGEIIADLENAIFSTLVNQEAKARNIDAGDLIAVEITNKIREFSNDERVELESSFRKRLFTKFSVKVMVREPVPVARNVLVDDDPASGKAAAPVTVVMFSDFQCSACSATHPVLKKVLGEYGDKVRFVVRDFPLESLHENAFRAALAANAARAQGKYFEYIDVLYRNQESLDNASLKKFAVDLGLNIKQFELDFSSEKAATEIRKDMADGNEYGIRGTPAIFVNGVKVHSLSIDGFRNSLDKALARLASK